MTDLRVVAAQFPLGGRIILVVDDEGPSREVLRYVLEADGARVVTAASATEALSLLDEVRPDALLVDISMPVVDGFTMVEQLRQRPIAKGGGIPVAALTGYMSGEDRSRAFRSGFQAYLVKPVEPSELVRTLRELTTSTHSATSSSP